MNAINRFDYPLYLVTDETTEGESLRHILLQALQGGVSIVQVRHKDHNIQTFIQRTQVTKQVIDEFNQQQIKLNLKPVPLIINDRVDVALAVNADGVHLGQSDMSAVLARQILGPDKIIGLTVENQQQLLQAQTLPIDYLGISTIFNTATKTDTQYQWGIKGLTEAVLDSDLPLVAIGGIDKSNIVSIAKTKVDSIALVSAIFAADSPKEATIELLALIQSS
ncbi:thiamine phosphate synthase [Vibrio sp. S11_S32]|uniref:thiamine phosphate synthase n=1 Tax=Vibrio sp. S11_S32 TaxID=2720225 RepID=UPI00168070D2|nr:thiamine phosphate synthase [Vibrio sp. S11_S32]MBD1575566.1 thiamine phosphate synthase [Vibrio sp. S11_S32]